jgi:hypothetical protein
VTFIAQIGEPHTVGQPLVLPIESLPDLDTLPGYVLGVRSNQRGVLAGRRFVLAAECGIRKQVRFWLGRSPKKILSQMQCPRRHLGKDKVRRLKDHLSRHINLHVVDAVVVEINGYNGISTAKECPYFRPGTELVHGSNFNVLHLCGQDRK